MAGTTLMDLLVKLKLDSAEFESGLDKSESRAQSAGGKIGGVFSSVGSALGKVSFAAFTAGIAAVGAAAASTAVFLKSCVEPASGLAESMNAVNVVFGDASASIVEFGKSSASTVGLSTRAFNELATTSGSLLSNLGMSQAEAATETIRLTQRAADMASVFNTDVSQSMTAIQAAIRGETEPIRKFGVMITQDAVQAKALAMGLIESGQAMDQNSKAAATLALIYEQTDKVAGDFKNTSTGYANSMRILSQTMENVKATIGQSLLPALAGLATQGSGYLTQLQDIINNTGWTKNQKMQAGSWLMDQIISDITKKIPEMANTGVQILTAVVKGLSTAIPKLIPVLNTVLLTITNFFITAIPMLGPVGMTIITGLLNSIITNAPLILPGVVAILTSILDGIVSCSYMLLESALQIILGLAAGIIANLPAMIDTIIQLVGTVAQWIIEALPTIIEAGISMLMALVNGIIGAIPQLIAMAPWIIQNLVTAIIANLPTLVKAALQLIVALVLGITQNLPALAEAAVTIVMTLITGIFDMLPEIGTAAGQLITTLVTGIANLATQLWEAGKNIVDGIWKGIQSMADKFRKDIENFFTGIVDAVKGLLGIASPSKVFKGIGKNTILGLAAGLSDMNPVDRVMDKLNGAMVKDFSMNVAASTSGMTGLVSQGGGQTTNQYNLTMVVTESPQAVQQGFGMMAALSGG